MTVKRKNLDVLAEYNKSKRKKSANFVVIGRSSLDITGRYASDWI